jgi:hypothetical protein
MARSAAEEYFAREFEPAIPGYRSRKAGDRDLLSMTKAALLEAVQTVGDLPRSHWVWQPGYAVQTVNVYRIRDLCTFRLRENPLDERALWTRIGLALQGPPADFGRDAFDRLRKLDGFEVSWPVYAACFIQRAWAASQSVGLGKFLREAGLLAEAGPVLAAIRERRDPYIDVFESEELTREYAAECLEIALWEPPAD